MDQWGGIHIFTGTLEQWLVDFHWYREQLKNILWGTIYTKVVHNAKGKRYEYLYLTHSVSGGHPFQSRVKEEDRKKVMREVERGNWIHAMWQNAERAVRFLKRRVSEEEMKRCAAAAAQMVANRKREKDWGACQREYAAQYPDRYKVDCSGHGIVRSRLEGLFLMDVAACGIPQLYEYETELDGRTYRPDDTLLIGKKAIIVELCGKMDDPDYVRENYESRKALFRRNGLKQGRDFIVLCCREHQKYNGKLVRDILMDIKAGDLPKKDIWIDWSE